MQEVQKHAYLIMAHDDFYILEKLLELIDDKRNDIFLHVDKKSKSFDREKIIKIIKNSNIYFIDRMEINWGGFSQVKCELKLLETATQNRNYTYYHLLSGIDMPLKTQNEIHKFMNENLGKIFIHFAGEKIEKEHEIKERISRYYPMQEYMKHKNKIVRKISMNLKNIIEKIQIKLKIDRTKKIDKAIKTGANWFSITDECAKYILENKKYIYKHFKSSYCADELFIQTLIYNTKFMDKLYYNKMDDNYISCMRKIDWTRGCPYIYKSEDFDELIHSNYIFARKFSTDVDKKIVDLIYEYLKK
ncbi:MAG: beta-1,6-N-acetylglucosaminyltransferase [Clostridia bacterium]|nr:beta-1,6-N-acetylglucosaminyltransferase [Clostridia bacterium]